MTLTTDSTEYDILQRAVQATQSLDMKALSCEIGLREGGGTAYMLHALWNSGQGLRTHIAIDPYGNIEYETAEGVIMRHDYTNNMRNRCMRDLYDFIEKQFAGQMNCLVFNLEDTEFFERFADGVPIYADHKRLADQYAVVHFDGPHAIEPLKTEVEFFLPRLVEGAHVVFDDVANYDHNSFEQWLFEVGFQLVERGERKASYKFK